MRVPGGSTVRDVCDEAAALLDLPRSHIRLGVSPQSAQQTSADIQLCNSITQSLAETPSSDSLYNPCFLSTSLLNYPTANTPVFPPLPSSSSSSTIHDYTCLKPNYPTPQVKRISDYPLHILEGGDEFITAHFNSKQATQHCLTLDILPFEEKLPLHPPLPPPLPLPSSASTTPSSALLNTFRCIVVTNTPLYPSNTTVQSLAIPSHRIAPSSSSSSSSSSTDPSSSDSLLPDEIPPLDVLTLTQTECWEGTFEVLFRPTDDTLSLFQTVSTALENWRKQERIHREILHLTGLLPPMNSSAANNEVNEPNEQITEETKQSDEETKLKAQQEVLLSSLKPEQKELLLLKPPMPTEPITDTYLTGTCAIPPSYCADAHGTEDETDQSSSSSAAASSSSSSPSFLQFGSQPLHFHLSQSEEKANHHISSARSVSSLPTQKRQQLTPLVLPYNTLRVVLADDTLEVQQKRRSRAHTTITTTTSSSSSSSSPLELTLSRDLLHLQHTYILFTVVNEITWEFQRGQHLIYTPPRTILVSRDTTFSLFISILSSFSRIPSTRLTIHFTNTLANIRQRYRTPSSLAEEIEKEREQERKLLQMARPLLHNNPQTPILAPSARIPIYAPFPSASPLSSALIGPPPTPFGFTVPTNSVFTSIRPLPLPPKQTIAPSQPSPSSPTTSSPSSSAPSTPSSSQLESPPVAKRKEAEEADPMLLENRKEESKAKQEKKHHPPPPRTNTTSATQMKLPLTSITDPFTASFAASNSVHTLPSQSVSASSSSTPAPPPSSQKPILATARLYELGLDKNNIIALCDQRLTETERILRFCPPDEPLRLELVVREQSRIEAEDKKEKKLKQLTISN